MDKALKQKSSQILKVLKIRYPGATTALRSKDPFQLLVAVILSAQCTDERVNMVTMELFKEYKNAEDFASLEQDVLEQIIYSTGFFRNKAKNIISMSKKILKYFEGRVPAKMEDLLILDGVARKTANIVLYHGFGKNVGIAVDTHVFRVTARLGIASGKNPEVTEKELMELFPSSSYGMLSDMIIFFGRKICESRKPKCYICSFIEICDYYNKSRN